MPFGGDITVSARAPANPDFGTGGGGLASLWGVGQGSGGGGYGGGGGVIDPTKKKKGIGGNILALLDILGTAAGSGGQQQQPQQPLQFADIDPVSTRQAVPQVMPGLPFGR